MTRRLVLSYLAVTALVLFVLEIPLGLTFARSERDRLTTAVERDARVFATRAEDTLEGRSDDPLQKYADEYERAVGGRVVVVDADGISVADSEAPTPRDFSTRPEIAAVLDGGENTASGIRRSDTLDERIVYVAVPIASGGEVHGAVRVTYPTATLDRRVRRQWLSLAALAGVVLATVAVVGFVLARSVTRPVRDLEAAANAVATGDLGARAPTGPGPPELRALARQFNDMAARLEALVGAQRAFVADASHELRTPLTALRLRLENLERAGADADPEDLAAAHEEVGRLARLVEGLLALARAEGGRPERVPVDVGATAAERVEVWTALAEEQGVSLALASTGEHRALAVPGAVAQVLDNLLANALEVAPENSTVVVEVRSAGDAVELHVVDTGPGLQEEERARAFDRFWRGPSASEGGSGLGLAIVAQLAVASGGEASLAAAPTGGIDACVRLPACRARDHSETGR